MTKHFYSKLELKTCSILRIFCIFLPLYINTLILLECAILKYYLTKHNLSCVHFHCWVVQLLARYQFLNFDLCTVSILSMPLWEIYLCQFAIGELTLLGVLIFTSKSFVFCVSLICNWYGITAMT